MPRACTVCCHPDRAAIDAALTARVSIRDVASRFACGRNAVHRHASHPSSPVSVPTPPVSTPAVSTPPTPPPPALTTRRAKQRAFLQALRETGLKLHAAKQAGLDKYTPFRWAATDAAFAEKMAEAQADGDQVRLARYERELRDRALAGTKDNASALLLMFGMKKLDPRYRDGSGVQINAQGPVAITLGLEAEQAPQDVVVEAHARDVTPRRVKEIA